MRSPRFSPDELRRRVEVVRSAVPLSLVVEQSGVQLRPHGREKLGLCPFHPDRNPSFGVRDDRGFFKCWSCGAFGDVIDYVTRVEGCTFGQALEKLERQGGVDRLDAAELAQRAVERERLNAEDRRKALQKARRAWARASRPARGGLVDRYLTETRSLNRPADGWPGVIRFVREAWHPTGARVPAMAVAAALWPHRRVSTVQFTALADDGRKAKVDPARWSIGYLQDGAAVRLAPYSAERPLVLVEGTEDGLAVLQEVPEVGAWSLLGAGTARNVVVPEGAAIILALDGDRAGREATFDAALALERRGHVVGIADVGEGFDPAGLLAAEREG